MTAQHKYNKLGFTVAAQLVNKHVCRLRRENQFVLTQKKETKCRCKWYRSVRLKFESVLLVPSTHNKKKKRKLFREAHNSKNLLSVPDFLYCAFFLQPLNLKSSVHTHTFPPLSLILTRSIVLWHTERSHSTYCYMCAIFVS